MTDVLALLRDDELSPTRPAYAYCMVLACVEARRCRYESVVVAEFGVAWGEGLRELARIAPLVSDGLGSEVSVVGFDRGGLPAPRDRRDHPEIWHENQFSNESLDELVAELAGRAEFVVGDLADTVGPFAASLSRSRPLGAVLLDVDLYSSASEALSVLDVADPACYLPAMPLYADDVGELLTYNARCGEALAIAEHNQASEHRFIEHKPVRVGWPSQRWHEKIYVCHVLDHPVRSAGAAEALEISVDRY